MVYIERGVSGRLTGLVALILFTRLSFFGLGLLGKGCMVSFAELEIVGAGLLWLDCWIEWIEFAGLGLLG